MIYETTVTQFTKMLNNLNNLLDKANQAADSKKYDVNILLNSRLSPDQFPLVRQIQIACDTAKLAAHRLTTKEAPKHDDSEKNLAEIKTRVSETIAYLGTFKESDYTEAKSRHITQPRWEGQWLTGEEFVMHHVIPNFYFHVTTSYAILRHNGVEVGKKDYLGAMPYKK